MTREKTLETKKFKIKNKKSNEFYIVEISARIRVATRKDWENLKEDKFTNLSITGSLFYSNGSKKNPDFITFGQINTALREIQKDVQWIFPTRLNKVLEIWDEYHLNDLQAGTKRQTELLKILEAEKLKYDEKLKILKKNGLEVDQGYKYGSEWLAKRIPEKILEELEEILTN